jgi:hypothetical protein
MVSQSLAAGPWLAAACAASADPSLKTGGLTLNTMDLGKVPGEAEVYRFRR